MKKQDDGFTYWTYKTFNLLQIFPSRDFVGVYLEVEDTGPAHFASFPLDGVALAEVAIHYMRKKGNADSCEDEYNPPEEERMVVGLELSDGYWEVAEEADNFAGMCRVGEDITKATGELSGRYRKLLDDAKAP